MMFAVFKVAQSFSVVFACCFGREGKLRCFSCWATQYLSRSGCASCIDRKWIRTWRNLTLDADNRPGVSTPARFEVCVLVEKFLRFSIPFFFELSLLQKLWLRSLTLACPVPSEHHFSDRVSDVMFSNLHSLSTWSLRPSLRPSALVDMWFPVFVELPVPLIHHA